MELISILIAFIELKENDKKISLSMNDKDN